MDNLINRQDAIDALAKEMPSLTTPDGSGEFDYDIQITDEAFVDCMQIINELPSAEPKTGEWVWSDEDASWMCGACCCVFEEIDWKPNYNFCPNCGAKMGNGGEDE